MNTILQRPMFSIGLIICLLLVGACADKKKEQESESLKIYIDGSSTVHPITENVTQQYLKLHKDISVDLKVSGTSGGFAKFIDQTVEINNASRQITEQEKEACKLKGINYLEIKVGYDGIAIVTNTNNNWLNDLTVGELEKIWAEGDATEWSDLRAEWPGEEFVLFSPGQNSGTFDYFKEVMLEANEQFKQNVKQSENDNLLVKGISNELNSLGFFGLSYYENNKDKLKLVAVDNGNGPILPNATTIGNGTYSPLGRPLFIYVNKKLLNTAAGRKYVDFYISNMTKAATLVGCVPLSQTEVINEKKKLLQ